MANSAITKTSDEMVNIGIGSSTRRARKVQVSFTADDSDGSIPTLELTDVRGYLVQVSTNPGSTAPTDNYDIALNNADGADVAGGSLADRDTSNSEVVNFTTPPLVAEDLTVTITNNAVNSATGTIILYLDDLR